MTPVQAGSHAAPAPSIVVSRRGVGLPALRVHRQLLGPGWQRLLLVTDLVVLCMASSCALFAAPSIRRAAINHWLAAIFPLAIIALIRARRSIDERLNLSLLEETGRIVGVVSVGAMLTIALEAAAGSTDPLGLASRLWMFSLVYLGSARIMLLAARRRASRNGELGVPTLIVGAGMVGTHVVKRLLGEPAYGLRPVAFLDSDPLTTAGGESRTVPVIGGLKDFSSALALTGARHVILAFSGERDHLVAARVRQCEALGIGVSLIPRMYESFNERATLDHLGGLPLLTLHPVDPRGWQFAVKHLFDRTAALIGLLLVGPLMVAIAIAVRASSPGPIWFRQRRVGRDGREFDVLKFRTMSVAAPTGTGFDLPDGVAPGGVEGTDRRTRLGRILRDLSLDELPQLLNVLWGDMSLVGPRPERPEYVQRFSRDVARYEDRHRVKSGITGWAQVNGLRGQTSIADRVEWDNYYIQNWSLRLDFRIMLLTIAEMFRQRDSANSRPEAASGGQGVGRPVKRSTV